MSEAENIVKFMRLNLANFDEDQRKFVEKTLDAFQVTIDELATVTAERDALRRYMPNWNNAPKQATHAAMDENGTWSWHKYEPVPCAYMWTLMSRCGDVHFGNWQFSMQRRPE
jgi:hypothetical protein